MPIVVPDHIDPFLGWEEEGSENMTPGERLKHLRMKRGYKTASEAARAMGVEPPTYRAHEENRGTEKSLARYARFFQVPIDYFYGRGQSLTLGNETKQPPIVAQSEYEGLPVKGFVTASAWQETYTPDSDLATLPISGVAGYPKEQQFALEIRGESINRRAKPGSYAVCVEWPGSIATKDVVVVEKRRNGFFQSTIKVARVRDGEIELWPDSDHPEHQKPIIVTRKMLADGDEVAVVAKVIGYYSKA